MRVVGIVAPFAPRGASIGGKFVLSIPRECWAHGTCTGCPKQRYAKEEPVKNLGRDLVGIVEGTSGYRARGVSIRGEICFIEKPGVQE